MVVKAFKSFSTKPGATISASFFVFISQKDKKRRVNLHTKIVLTMTAILIIVGAILYYIFGYNNSLDLFSTRGKIFVSFFQSITTCSR